jgi:hypothetical protein
MAKTHYSHNINHFYKQDLYDQNYDICHKHLLNIF